MTETSKETEDQREAKAREILAIPDSILSGVPKIVRAIQYGETIVIQQHAALVEAARAWLALSESIDAAESILVHNRLLASVPAARHRLRAALAALEETKP